MIQLLVDPVYTQINGLTNRTVIDALSNDLSYIIPNYKYSFQFKSGGWDGRERLLTKRLKFPTGLLERACLILKSFSLDYNIIEQIKYPIENSKIEWLGPNLYPYQMEVVERALSAKRGMIKACTGSGKTFMISKIVSEYNLQTMIYVVSLDLLSQMKETLELALGIEIGIIGDGKCNIQKITVCSVWTAGLVCGEKKVTNQEEDLSLDKWDPDLSQKEKILEAIKSAKLIILDEAQFAAASSIRMILKNSMSASYRFGCTATPWRSGGDDILLEAAFGARICDIPASKLIKEGYLVQPRIYFRDIPPQKGIKKKWSNVEASYIIDNDIRNRILINNVVKLLEMGRRPLVLFRKLRHGDILLDLLPSDIRVKMVTGSLKTSERDEIRHQFKDGKIDLLFASTVYDQGIDIKELDALVLCGGGKSTAKALQRVGRVIRGNQAGNKKDAIIVDTFDQSHFVKQHSIIRYGAYTMEQEFVIKYEPAMTSALN